MKNQNILWYYSAKTLQKPIQGHKLRSFVYQRKIWRIEPDERQVSYDVINLYPSIKINKAIDLILQELNNDYEEQKWC